MSWRAIIDSSFHQPQGHHRRKRCQLAKQRRIRPLNRKKLESGERLMRTRFGVDDDVCTGDHSCIRLSGCPSLTIKPNPDPLRKDPVAHVNDGCVGCGLCGEVNRNLSYVESGHSRV